MVRSAATHSSQALAITAPAKGWAIPLNAIPDPAFASGALGEGVGLELLDDMICAPCDATVAAIASAQHAITLEISGGTGAGAQILIHCGIDTVALNGAPFTVLVAEGQQVAAGDPLMRVDLESVVHAGKSLATPIISIEPAGHRLTVAQPHAHLCERGGALLTIEPAGMAGQAAAGAAAAGDDTAFTATHRLALPLPHGLHARPCAAIAAEAGKFAGPVELACNGNIANANSITAMMKLGAVHNAQLTIKAGGPDAEAAVASLAALIAAGAGDDIAAPAPTPGAASDTAPALLRRQDHSAIALADGELAGIAAAPGEALGAAYYLHRARIEVSETSLGIAEERARLADGLAQLHARLGHASDHHDAEIAAAHRGILNDPALAEVLDARITAGASAAMAWQAVMGEEAEALAGLSDPRLSERADDFRDLEQQLICILIGKETQLSAPAGAIVIADDLYPSDLKPLAAAGIAGIATMRGGATSHLAILAASAGIPMVAAFGKQLCDVEEGELVHLDGDQGRLRRGLSDTDRDALARHMADRSARYTRALEAAQDDTVLASGERIEVFANLGNVEDAQEARALGAEGSGLVRTEFLFLDRATPPAHAEQAQIYRAIFACFDDKPVIFRTLDIGADKPASYLPMEAEDNPALGVRGIRIGLRYPDLLRTQLRAILSAAGARTAYIMAPMVTGVDEVDALRAMLDEVVSELNHAGPAKLGAVKLGAMIETPASALIAPVLAARLDFLSVGTNDLTQYTLAVDRTNSEVAAMQDPMHPGVLRLIGLAGDACEAAACPLGVCGSAAGDRVAAHRRLSA